MSCIDNFIGLSKTCNAVEPTSGLNIDMLPGISLKSLSLNETGKYVTAQNLINDKMKLVFSEVQETFNSLIDGNAVEHSIEAIITKNFDNEFGEASSERKGLKITKAPTKLSSLFLERIYLCFENEVTDLEVTITDGYNPVTVTVNCDAGEEVSVDVNYSTTQKSILVTYEDSEVIPANDSISPFHSIVTGNCRDCHRDGSAYMQLRGVEGESENLITYRGIRADVSVQCDREKMLCLIMDRNKTAVLYLLGVQILREVIAGDRVNFLAINSKEWAKETIPQWIQTAAEMIDNNSQGIANYLMSKEKECFICNHTHHAYILP